MSVKAVIFDLDGTLTKFNLDIKGIKREILGRDSSDSLLDIIDDLKGPERARAKRILEARECEAAKRVELNKGARRLLARLSEAGIRTGVVTRNNKRAVEIITRRFGMDFDVVVSREDAKPKPSKEQLEKALRALGVEREEAVFVGDHRFDLEAGKAAGIKTGLVKNEFSQGVLEEADFVIGSLEELEGHLFP
jgi:HAD superfamily hydrolase (TIGR01509 family)